MNTTNKALTVKDVASYLNVDEKTIYRLVSKGSIPGFKVSGSWRFQLQDIQGWIDRQKAGAQSAARKREK
jgi:excisionase family DNA binding protein